MKKHISQLKDEERRTGDELVKVIGSSLIVRRAEQPRQVDAGQPGWTKLHCG